MSSDTLLRHMKTHRARHNVAGPHSVGGWGNMDSNQRLNSRAAMSDDTSMILGSTLDSDLDLEDATLGLTETAHNRRSVLLQDHSTTTRPNSDVFSGDQVMINDHATMNVPTAGDQLLNLDFSNWLLDENLVDLGLGESWIEPVSANERSQPMPPPMAPAEQCDKPPVVPDLRPIWYNQPRRTVDSLHDDYEGTKRQHTTTFRRDIDDTYRTHMVKELCTPLPNDPLPSLDFLVQPFVVHFAFHV